MIPDHDSRIIPKPSKKEVKFKIGPYLILEEIGKGGMGEVYLAYDTICGRKIALKRIRPDLAKHPQLLRRFLKEARITSQLSHPAIIPIYAIQKEGGSDFYTMPYAAGKTLRQILMHARQRERQGLPIEHHESIPALCRIFLNICQAIAYAHSKGVIHRDIKPANIIVGEFGEVSILDWGLAKIVQSEEDHDLEPLEENLSETSSSTRVGRIVGTVAYLAPERIRGQEASFQTDVYALGVILYQILTLRHPFRRGKLKQARAELDHEILYDPSEIAPYRDVPPDLSRIVLRCLAPSPQNRFESVEELIHHIENYLEGRSEWFSAANLDLQNKEDWEFQENVLITEHTAITRGTELSEWVLLMLSKNSFFGNTRIDAKTRIINNGQGIGFLLGVPEKGEREQPNSGYSLWIASEDHKNTKLLRSSAEVLYAPEVFLKANQWYHIRIEKIENSIYFYLNDILQFSYISYLPLGGTHIGVLMRDINVEIEDFIVSLGSQNMTVNCLAIPDAFLAHNQYASALSEYRRLSYTFSGTTTAREALFRAGITLLEEARRSKDPEKSTEALDEFEKLRKTPGAPLEYLGKALVYQMLDEYDEEAKCFELAYRRYPNHPLLPLLKEQLAYRMYESARSHRKGAYRFVLLVLRHLPEIANTPNAERLFNNIKRNWERLYFIDDSALPEELQNTLFTIQIAFWLDKPHVLEEIVDELIRIHPPDLQIMGNALFALIELGYIDLAKTKFEQLYERMVRLEALEDNVKNLLDLLRFALKPPEEMTKLFEILPQQIRQTEMRIFIFLLERALYQQKFALIHTTAQKLKKYSLTPEFTKALSSFEIWAFLAEKNWAKAGEELQKFPQKELLEEHSILHFLYGCWLFATKGRKVADEHFSTMFEMPYPRSWMLFSHYYYRTESEKKLLLKRLFPWEERQLEKQLSFFKSLQDH